MDVRLSYFKFLNFFLIFSFLSFSISCGSQMNTDTAHGRQARIDEANFQLSNGQCQAALDAIGPLYNSKYITDEIRIIMASSYACFAGFNLLAMVTNMAGASSYFAALAKTMPNSIGDGKITNMYKAIDVLTNGNTVLTAAPRSKSINTYMIFLQFALVGEILNGYGLANAAGAKTVALSYSNPRVAANMSNLDACALSAAMSAIVDSYIYSNLVDPDTAAAKNALNNACVTAGYASCTIVGQDRTACTGLAGDTPSIRAVNVVGAINGVW